MSRAIRPTTAARQVRDEIPEPARRWLAPLHDRTHFQIPEILNTENHYFRQDVDSWMMNVAVRYGAQLRRRQPVVDVDIDDDGVTLSLKTGTTVRAKFVVDASGYRSVLADKFGLREESTRFRHHSYYMVRSGSQGFWCDSVR